MDKPLNIKELSWSLVKRFEFIEFRLFWDERINRGDLQKAFSISMPQASSDFSRYQDIAPDNMLYDKKLKYYYPSEKFVPIFSKPSSDQFLLRYIALDLGIYTPQSSFLGDVPPIGTVPRPWRRVDVVVLKTVLTCIREKKSILIEYQSMRRPKKTIRWISPTALGFDGFRWHCRAFCQSRNEFRDFNLGRIWNINDIKRSDKDASDDFEWNTFTEVKIGPHPSLEEGPKKAIEYEYGMKNGEISISVRVSMLFYLLKRLGFDTREKAEEHDSQQIVLLNREEVEKFLHK